MTTNYTLTGRALLASGNYRAPLYEPEPFGASGLAILSDGTFFASVWMERNGADVGLSYPLRMWHLAKDLTVLGTVDVPFADFMIPFAVPLSGKRVLSIVTMDATAPVSPNWYVTTVSIVDCSGDTPAPGPITTYPASTFQNDSYGACGPVAVMDQANGRVVVASWGGIQIFSLTDGLLLGSWSQAYWSVMALARDVADPFHFVGTDGDGKDWDFTIDASNTITLNSSFDVPYATDIPFPYSYPLGAASLPLPSSIVSANDGPDFESWPGGLPPHVLSSAPRTSYDQVLQYFDGPTHALAELDLGKFWGHQWVYESNRDDGHRGPFPGWESDGYVDVSGEATTLLNGRHQIAFYEHGTNVNFWGVTAYADGIYDSANTFNVHNDGGACEFRWRMVAVDKEHPELGFEVIDLDYFGFIPPGTDSHGRTYTCTPPDGAAVSLGAGSPGLAVDQDSGMMLVGMTCVNNGPAAEQQMNFMVWTIQGPSAKPDLTGKLLDDRVRFHGWSES